MSPNVRIGNVFTKLSKLGVFLREKGFYQESIECFEALAGNDDSYENGDYALQIGINYELIGNIDEAKKYYSIAVSANPGVAEFREAASRLGISLPTDPAPPSRGQAE